MRCTGKASVANMTDLSSEETDFAILLAKGVPTGTPAPSRTRQGDAKLGRVVGVFVRGWVRCFQAWCDLLSGCCLLSRHCLLRSGCCLLLWLRHKGVGRVAASLARFKADGGLDTDQLVTEHVFHAF